MRGGDRGPQRTGQMRNLVVAMAQALVAQAHRQDKFAGKHRRPELDVGVLATKVPRMIVAVSDSAFDGALQIDAPKRMLTCHSRDHAVVKTFAGATAGHEADVRRKRLLDKARIAASRAHALESLARQALVGVVFGGTLRHVFQRGIEWRHREAAVGNHREKILGGADQLQWSEARSRKNRHADAVRHVPAAKLGRITAIAARGDFVPCDRLETGLRLREIDMRAELEGLRRLRIRPARTRRRTPRLNYFVTRLEAFQCSPRMGAAAVTLARTAIQLGPEAPLRDLTSCATGIRCFPC